MSIINKQFIKQLQKSYSQHEGERRQIISRANIILHDSKRVIFSLHRKNNNQAEQSLQEIEKQIKDLEKKFGYNRLMEEGSYKAAMEEYVEAKLFYGVVTENKINKISGQTIGVDSYLGGLSDLTGELVRRAVNQAAEGNTGEVGRIKEIIDEVMDCLVDFDITGYLRTKYDQAKNNLKKIEQINYEIKLRK